MELLILLLVVFAAIGGGIWVSKQAALKQQQTRQAELESQLAVSKKPAEEDVTKFGEELQMLDIDVKGHALDEAMQQDYTQALDSYDDAKRSLDAVKTPDEIRNVTEILEDGRYAVACVKARLNNQPLPQKRPPCFFNPAHGPSSENVNWAPAGGAPRDVPACAADAQRVKAGAEPIIRTVPMGSRRVPYWEGGPAYQPYAQGYYRSWAGSDMLTGMMIGGMLFGGGGGLFSGIGYGMGGMMEGIGDGFEGIGEGVGGMMEGIGDGFQGFGEGLGDMFGDFFGD